MKHEDISRMIGRHQCNGVQFSTRIASQTDEFTEYLYWNPDVSGGFTDALDAVLDYLGEIHPSSVRFAE